ncbi:MarR family transcriptional regulator [Caballeronia sp. AZ10_KS36]|uniref:MarR family winged helix-turn-helix transcriptional regulator n=1 Tax=Caballeronia sp. AZ10_KS36 TaxID=2921757 RepID=UPI002027F4C9|nr:MarR family transcriptional regulator [Caballeronia sp. AZ10_KS36]
MKTPCLCTDLRRASRKLTEAYDAALASFEINIAQYFLMRTIADHQPVSLTQLGALVDLDRSTIGRNVKVLESRELTHIGIDPGDQRERVVSLTSDGKALLRRATPAWDRCQVSVREKIGLKKVEALRSMLAELGEAIT